MIIELSKAYVPEKGHVTHFINDLIESLKIKPPYIFSRPKEYDLGMLLKLLFTYTRNIYTGRKIKHFAQEN